MGPGTIHNANHFTFKMRIKRRQSNTNLALPPIISVSLFKGAITTTTKKAAVKKIKDDEGEEHHKEDERDNAKEEKLDEMVKVVKNAFNKMSDRWGYF